jgi:hypothetical protein
MTRVLLEECWTENILLQTYLNNNDSNHTHNDKKEECHDTFVGRNLQNHVFNFQLVLVRAHRVYVSESEKEGVPGDQSLSLVG